MLTNYGIPKELVKLPAQKISECRTAVTGDGESTEWSVWGSDDGATSHQFTPGGHDAKSTKNNKRKEERVNNLRFADDVDLLAEDPQQLQDIINAVNNSSKRFGLKINAQKVRQILFGSGMKN